MNNEQYSMKENVSAGLHGFKHLKVCSGFFCLPYKFPLLLACWLISLTSSPAMHSYPNSTPGRNCLWLIRIQLKSCPHPKHSLDFCRFLAAGKCSEAMGDVLFQMSFICPLMKPLQGQVSL